MARSAVAVVVVTRNRPEDYERCVASVLRQTAAVRLVVLDNCSDEDKRPGVPAGATLVRTSTPLGVAAARNLAMTGIAEPFAVLIDDDAEFADSDTLERMLRVFAAEPQVAAVALNCLAVSPGQVEAGLEQIYMVYGIRNLERARDAGGESVVPAGAFVGAGCGFRTEVFRSLGGFNEEYLYGYEELHFTLRLLDRGWGLLYLPSARVYHYHSRAWRLGGAERLRSQFRNKWALAAELIPLPWIPFTLGPFSVRMALTIWRARGGVLGAVAEAGAAFGRAWRQRRPLQGATVRQALALRGRL